jgi:hypothetical protein
MAHTKLKTLRSHTAHAQFLATCDETADGFCVIAGYLPRALAPANDRYHYSPVVAVYRLADEPSRLVAIFETAHRKYEVWAIDRTRIMSEARAIEVHLSHTR